MSKVDTSEGDVNPERLNSTTTPLSLEEIRELEPDQGGKPLSPESEAALDAGIRSGRAEESVYLGSFAKYADDDQGGEGVEG